MTESVHLRPIRRGYDYELLVDPENPDWLADGETFRAELRTTASGDLVTTFMVERDGPGAMLTLTGDQTRALKVRPYVMDLTLVLADGSEHPLVEPRFLIRAEDHVTRASEGASE